MDTFFSDRFDMIQTTFFSKLLRDKLDRLGSIKLEQILENGTIKLGEDKDQIIPCKQYIKINSETDPQKRQIDQVICGQIQDDQIEGVGKKLKIISQLVEGHRKIVEIEVHEGSFRNNKLTFGRIADRSMS